TIGLMIGAGQLQMSGVTAFSSSANKLLVNRCAATEVFSYTGERQGKGKGKPEHSGSARFQMLGRKLCGVSVSASVSDANKPLVNSSTYTPVGKVSEPGRLINQIISNNGMQYNSKTQRRVTVFWDVQNCGVALPPPPPPLVYQNIVKYLLSRGIDDIITDFNAYGTMSAPQLDEVIKEIGLLVDLDEEEVFRSILCHIYQFLWPTTPKKIVVLISANRDFARALRKLEERHFTFVVVQLTNDGEVLEWPEMNSLNGERLQPNALESESNPNDQTRAEPCSCELEPARSQFGIFWDLEVCGVPKGVPYDSIAVNIKKYLNRHGINEEITTFNVYGDFSTVPQAFLEACNKTGISIIDEKKNSVEKTIIVDMLTFDIDCVFPSTSTILLISDRKFSPAFVYLQRSAITFLLAVPNLKTTDPYVIRQAKEFVWEWPEMAADGGS
ncbi:hypothetical protein KI387_010071, partial [Taxus chinensis]